MTATVQVLALNKFMMRFMGLMLSKRPAANAVALAWIVVLIGIQLAVWFPIFAHLLYIWGDISSTTDAMYTVCTFSMALEMYVILVLRRVDLNGLFDALETIIHNSMLPLRCA